MKPKVFFLLLVPLYVVLNGCYQNPTFSNRIAHSDLSPLNIPDSNIERLNIIWKPKDFPEMVELQGATRGATGAVYWGGWFHPRNVRIPTGIAISERLLEALGHSLIIDKTSSNSLKIDVYAHTRASFNLRRKLPLELLFSGKKPCPRFNRGTVKVNAFFNYKDIELPKEFHEVELIDGSDCSITTGPLETAWDKVAIQMAQLIILFINQVESRDISNLDQLRKNSLGIVYCASEGRPQYVELWQCD